MTAVSQTHKRPKGLLRDREALGTLVEEIQNEAESWLATKKGKSIDVTF